MHQETHTHIHKQAHTHTHIYEHNYCKQTCISSLVPRKWVFTHIVICYNVIFGGLLLQVVDQCEPARPPNHSDRWEKLGSAQQTDGWGRVVQQPICQVRSGERSSRLGWSKSMGWVTGWEMLRHKLLACLDWLLQGRAPILGPLLINDQFEDLQSLATFEWQFDIESFCLWYYFPFYDVALNEMNCPPKGFHDSLPLLAFFLNVFLLTVLHSTSFP